VKIIYYFLCGKKLSLSFPLKTFYDLNPLLFLENPLTGVKDIANSLNELKGEQVIVMAGPEQGSYRVIKAKTET